jgi:hypothetical protein
MHTCVLRLGMAREGASSMLMMWFWDRDKAVTSEPPHCNPSLHFRGESSSQKQRMFLILQATRVMLGIWAPRMAFVGWRFSFPMWSKLKVFEEGSLRLSEPE